MPVVDPTLCRDFRVPRLQRPQMALTKRKNPVEIPTLGTPNGETGWSGRNRWHHPHGLYTLLNRQGDLGHLQIVTDGTSRSLGNGRKM